MRLLGCCRQAYSVQLLVATIAPGKEFPPGMRRARGRPPPPVRSVDDPGLAGDVVRYARGRALASSPMSSSSTSLVSRTFARTKTNDSAAKIAYMR